MGDEIKGEENSKHRRKDYLSSIQRKKRNESQSISKQQSPNRDMIARYGKGFSNLLNIVGSTEF